MYLKIRREEITWIPQEFLTNEVAKDIDHLVVDPLGKELPGEVQLLGVARVSEQVIPEVIGGKTAV